MTTLYIIGILLLVICLVLIFFVSKSERIVNLAYKFNMCEKEINVFLNNKEELILRVIGIIGRQLNTEFKVFESVKNIKASKINNYERDIYPQAYQFKDQVNVANENIVINPASESIILNPEMFKS